MKHFFKIAIVVTILVTIITSCQSNQEARKPISHASGTFMKQSVDRNKKLIAGEEAEIARVIRQNKNVKFIASTKGFWYSYIITNKKDTLSPKKGDVALFDYEVKDL
ncbi:MAG: gliding motility-associated peptidyl-prolyl isomerase GldI, partial [Bacteroidota bacterium]